MSVVDEVKSKLDIVEYVGRTTPLKKAGRVYKACCPFHSERTPSFVVDPDKQTWRCFGACAEGGDIFTFVMKQQGISFREALEELGKVAGVTVQAQTPEQKTRDEALDRLRGLLAETASFFHDALMNPADANASSALGYARTKRALSNQTLEAFGVGYAPVGWTNSVDHLTALGYLVDDILEAGVAIRNESGRVYDRFRNRLVIPIRDERGRVVGFGARALAADDIPKYLNSPQTPLFDKSHILFGLDLAARSIRDSETAVIVEGYMDAIQAHQAGFTNVVAQMGTAMTEAQLKLLAPRWAKKIILALDSDAAGQSATLRGLEVARETLQADYGGRLSVDIRILAIPDAKDPDDLIRETPARWQDLVTNATPVAEYVIATEVAGLSPNPTMQEREALARRVLPILVASENQLQRKDNVQKLALRLHIVERDLLAWADEQERLAKAKPPRWMPGDPPPPEPDLANAPPPFNGEPDVRPAAEWGGIRPPTRQQDIALEAHCLRLLLQHPELFYYVNRKFRELAGENAALYTGPLGDLNADDFSRTDYRVLMIVFLSAIQQDEMEVLDYMRAELEPDLVATVDALLKDEVDGLRTRISNRMGPDLLAAIKQTRLPLTPVDLNAEIVDKALRLRTRGLQRNREDMFFLQMDLQSQTEDPTIASYEGNVELSRLAKRLIEAELQRQASLSKQA